MFEVELKSKDLNEYIYLKLEKNTKEPLYYEELNKITEVHLNKLDIVDDETDVTIYDLIFFKNLKICYLSNLNISDKELDMLNNIESLEFLQINNCNFTGNKKINLKLQGLVIENCKNLKLSVYDNISTLKKLHIINCLNVDIKGISNLSNLSKLFLQNVVLNEINEVTKLKNLEYLNLNGSKIKDLSQIYRKENLEIEHKEQNVIFDEDY